MQTLAFSAAPEADTRPDAEGRFKTGIPVNDTFEVIVSHPGYISDTLLIPLVAGEIATQEVQLFPALSNLLSVRVRDSVSEQVVSGAQLLLGTADSSLTLEVLADSLGLYRDYPNRCRLSNICG